MYKYICCINKTLKYLKQSTKKKNGKIETFLIFMMQPVISLYSVNKIVLMKNVLMKKLLNHVMLPLGRSCIYCSGALYRPWAM